MTTYAGSGHRMTRLGGYAFSAYNKLVRFATIELRRLEPSHLTSGMAGGWDQALAQAACNLHIPWTAAIPCQGQELRWPVAVQGYYNRLLERADRIEICSPGPWRLGVEQIRNEWMVDHEDEVLALWNGGPGGTDKCLRYARLHHRPIVNVWDRWLVYQ